MESHTRLLIEQSTQPDVRNNFRNIFNAKINMDQVELAYYIAQRAFAHKLDRAKAPYIGHLKRVASKVESSTTNQIVLAAAWLHDLLEDCPEWNQKSLLHLFDIDVVGTVMILTKTPEQDYLKDYIPAIKESPWATTIKIADLEDNMDVRRLDKLTPKDLERLNKYHTAYKMLTT